MSKTGYQPPQSSGGAASPGGLGIFGNGADGVLVYDGAATILGMAPVANVYTLTRDIYPSSMTVNAGVTINENDFKIWCKGTLTFIATSNINHNGGDALLDAHGSGALAAGTVNSSATGGSTCPDGSDAGTGAGTGGFNANGYQLGGNGGAGGLGSSGAGGAGGAGSVPDPHYGGIQVFNALPFAVLNSGPTGVNLASGSAGGSGAGDGVNNGGGGGGASGSIVIAAKIIVGTGTIQAKGGAGGASAGAGNVGGGGGGGGGWIVVVTSAAIPNTITLDVSGGAGGAKHGTGVAGSAGSAGNIYQIVN